MGLICAAVTWSLRSQIGGLLGSNTMERLYRKGRERQSRRESVPSGQTTEPGQSVQRHCAVAPLEGGGQRRRKDEANRLRSEQFCKKSQHMVGRGLVHCAQAFDQAGFVDRAELIEHNLARLASKADRNAGGIGPTFRGQPTRIR